MQLRLHDTLSGEELPFVPLDPRRVRMYVCGPTVYDFAHIGNARPVIVFDVLFRLLRHIYGADRVVYVRNITDVDDRINARAAELGIPIRELTERTYRDFAEDVRALGCLPPTFEPRATEHIEEMKRLIERLVALDHAYVAEEHVLFHVPSMPDYGRLSKRPLDELIAGARVDVAPYKKNPMDFVLWKPSKPGEPAWPSPHGISTPGRPGWHIECSAMSWRHLGEMFDIHGGGIDLVFPHHENEIAQSRSSFHTPLMARFWVHNEFLRLEGEKMAKSEGNVVTIRNLLKRYPGDVLRLLMLTSHYRQPIDWTEIGAERARNELLEWSEFVSNYFGPNEDLSIVKGELDYEFMTALLHDLHTPLALRRLREIFRLAKREEGMTIEDFVVNAYWMGFRHLNQPGFFHPGFDAHLYRSGPQIEGQDRVAQIIAYRSAAANNLPNIQNAAFESLARDGFVVQLDDYGVLFVGNKTSADMQPKPTLKPELFLSKSEFGNPTVVDVSRVQRLIQMRKTARKAKNFAEADRIRNELANMEVALADHPDGTTSWNIKRAWDERSESGPPLGEEK